MRVFFILCDWIKAHRLGGEKFPFGSAERAISKRQGQDRTVVSEAGKRLIFGLIDQIETTYMSEV